jgi:hypothetical protein
MPTILGNDLFNFKFEFYDLNNNYVPVFVTQSATFVGAPLDTSALVSASLSQSLDALYKVSSSISGTMTVYSSSASGSITVVSGSVFTLSGSVSSSLYSLSSSVSQSNATILSSSLSKVQQLANGQFSGSFIGDTVIYSPAIGGQVGYIKELFTVGDTSAPQINLDARTTTRKIYIGTGTYSNTNTPIYLDSTGRFSLADKLTFDTLGNLSVNGSITVTGGNAATDSNAALYAARAAASASISASAAQSNAASDATTKANIAITTSAISASNAALSASAAFQNAKAVADSIANGTYTGGTLISSTSIISPVIAGANGYISQTLKVGDNGITLNGAAKAIYIGTGTYGNANTAFYVDSTNRFSLGNKLTFDTSGNLIITGTINASSFNGGTITIGSRFSVDTDGNVNATNANLTGVVNADSGRFGSGTNFWAIGANTLENSVTTNGRLVLNAARPAMEIYDGSGELRVDISAASTFSNTEPIPISTSGDVTSQTSRSNSRSGTGSGLSLYDDGQYFHNQSVTFSGASAVGKVATIRIPVTGNAGTQTVVGTSIVSNIIGIVFGVRITKPDGTVVATLTGTRSRSTGTSGDAVLPSYAGTVLTAGLTLENTTYTATPFVTNISMQGFSSTGTTTSLSSIVYTPDFNGPIQVSVSVGKTEIVAGGVQIIRDSDNFVKIDRSPVSAAILQVTGQGTFTGDVTANTSDKRLKNNIRVIDNPLEKLSKINGVYFNWNDVAKKLANKSDNEEVGFLAQEVQSVLPHIIKPAPFDNDGYNNSKSGENYLTIQYEKIVPLLVEAIKELKKEIDELKNK